MIILTIGGQKHTLTPEDAHLLSLALTSVTEGKSASRGYRVRSPAFSVARAAPQSEQTNHRSRPVGEDTLTDC